MTLGPPHYAANAPPATSPPLPSPAATLGADSQASAPTHLGSMQTPQRHRPREPGAPAPNLTPNMTHLRPHWPANPPSTSLPPTPPAANHPLVPFPAPPPPPWAAPPTASDTPTSPIPLVLTPAPLATRCSTPAPMPPSLPMLRLDPPSPVEAPPPMPSMPPLAPPPTCKGRPLLCPGLLLGPAPNGREALHFPRSTAEGAPSLRPPRGGPTCPALPSPDTWVFHALPS
ncbi:hypothetical protein E4T56_gene13140 [Termitomyces sp. T112]|nr:hypothetical protein E4T56_gene13140 [Termitomyces sp. T112]